MKNLRLTLLPLLFSPSVFAMSLNEVFQQAIQKNESVPTQEENILQADENVKQAWGNIVPQLSESTQWMWQQSVPGPNGQFSPGYNPLSKLTASQPLFQGYREWNGLDQVEHTRNQQQHLETNVELTLYKTILTNYYQILYYEKDIVNLKDECRYLRDEIKFLQGWRKIGRAQTTDVLTAQASLAAQEVLIEQDTYQLKTLRDTFALNTGLPSDTTLDDDAQNFSPHVEDLDAYMDRVKNRPDVNASRDAVVAAEDNIAVQKANHLPSVALTADRYLDRVGIQQNVDWDAMIVMTVPIYSGGVTQSKVRQAYSQDHQAELALSLSERTAQEEVRQYYDSVKSDLQQVQLNKTNVSVNEAYYKEEERYLRLGLVPYLNVITALASYMLSKRTLDQAIFQLRGDFHHLIAATSADRSNLE